MRSGLPPDCGRFIKARRRSLRPRRGRRTAAVPGWAGAVSNHSAEIDPAALARVAIDKAVRSRSPQQRLQPGRYTVVLEPAAVAELLGFCSAPGRAHGG